MRSLAHCGKAWFLSSRRGGAMLLRPCCGGFKIGITQRCQLFASAAGVGGLLRIHRSAQSGRIGLERTGSCKRGPVRCLVGIAQRPYRDQQNAHVGQPPGGVHRHHLHPHSASVSLARTRVNATGVQLHLYAARSVDVGNCFDRLTIAREPAIVTLTADPIVLARDENNDLIVPMRFARGLEAAVILVRTALLLWRDEYYLNRDIGTPWLETEDGVVTERDAILGQPYDAAKIARVLKPVILGVSLVRDVTQFRTSFDGATRNLAVDCVVSTAFGDAPVAVQIAA